MMNDRIARIGALVFSLAAAPAQAADAPAPGSPAPAFQLRTTEGADFTLDSRKGKWTVLYFYPKDDTPGCTRQACAFRDSIQVIRKQGAEVYGISQDTVESHKQFTSKHQLNFPLLADVGGQVAKRYGADGFAGFSKRWTFIIDPQLKVRWVQKNVDPALNAKEVAEQLSGLQALK